MMMQMMVHQFFHFPYTYAIINLYVSIRCIFIHKRMDLKFTIISQ